MDKHYEMFQTNRMSSKQPAGDGKEPDQDGDPSTRTSSFGGLVNDAVSNTGMQGLPNVQRANSAFRKIFWLLICVIGVAVMTWQISLAVIKFYTYPTQTTVDYTYKTSLEFPAITICNNNPVVKSKLENSTEAAYIYSYITEQFNNWTSEYNNGTVPTEFDDWYTDPDQYSTDDEYEYYEGDYYFDDYEATADDVWFEGEEDPSFDFVEDFIALTSKLPRAERKKLGHQLATMIIGCQYQGKKCQTSHFHSFNNYLYGNCYTFNSGRNAQNTRTKLLRTSKIGPLYGFALELYIEQDEYIEGLADAAGIRLLIGNQTYMPFPEDFGISLMPGTMTSIGITRRDVYRSEAPHGSCKTYSEDENKQKNAFIADLSFINYTTSACRKTCFQQALIVNCSCFDYAVPTDEGLDAYTKLAESVDVDNLLPCYEDDVYAEKESCIKDMTNAFLNNTLGCADTCHVPCFEVEYPYSVSYAQWPSVASESRVLNVLARKSQELWDLVEDSSYDEVWKKQWMNNNFLKLEVYFTDLNYEVVKTSPSYDAIALISDLGGQAGLWLGVSVVAFFELFELLIDVIILTVKFCSAKAASRHLNKNSNNSKTNLDDGNPIGTDDMLPLKITTEAFTPRSRKGNRPGHGSGNSQVAPATLSDV